MKILYVEVGKPPEIREIDSSLESMQELVGGLIQVLYPFEDEVALVCNDEGKLLNLPLNRGLYTEDGSLYDIISGNFFLCGAPADAEDFVSLTEEQIKRYRKFYSHPEAFFKVGEEVIAVRC